MANIKLGVDGTDPVTLNRGTENDDIVTLDRELTSTAGTPAAEALVGGGGEDTLVLTNANNGLADFATSTTSVAYNSTTKQWTLNADTAGTVADVATLSDGFTTVTFSDGVTLVAGTASAGVSELAVDAGDPLDITTAAAYSWDGADLTAAALGSDYSIVSVDGIEVASAGTTFEGTDGSFVVGGADTVTFTPSAAALAAQGTVGDKATFSYEVVVAKADGTQHTVTVNVTEVIDFTAGDDTFNASEDNQSVNESSDFGNEDAGDDTFNGDDQNNTFTANVGNDTMYGGNGEDVLSGGANNDFLRGGNGADELDGGAGNDDLGGGANSDVIFGDAGNDVIFGGQGDDNTTDSSLYGLNGGTGDDMINGGAGNDILAGGSTANGTSDTLASGGDDTLRGGAGEDTLLGGVGDDELRGGADKDTVDGGAGEDLIYSSLGGDKLTGGGDNDTFVLKNGTGTTTITDFDGTGAGDDILNISELANTNVLDILANAYETEVNGTTSVVLSLDADTYVILEGQTINDLDVDDFTVDALA